MRSTLALLALISATAPFAVHATIVGDSVEATELYPNTSTSLGTTGPKTILAGGTDFGTVGQSEVDIVVGGATVTLTAVFPYTPLTATFDGFDIVDLSPGNKITGVSLDPASGTLPAGYLTFGAHDILVNLQGVALNPSSPIIVDFTSNPAVSTPEPASMILFGSMVGIAGLAAGRRRD